MARIVVLGIGNLLWADEGFGVRCVETLQHQYRFADNVELVDGGTQGLYLLHHVQQADCLLIFDAVDYDLAPGTLKIVRDDEVPKFMGAKKMSLHQTGFQEVLSLAELTGAYPDNVLLVGCQPEQLEDYGGSLRPVVKAAMDEAIRIGVEQLAEWGGEPQKRDVQPDESDRVTAGTLNIHAYESNRPEASVACRNGDSRFFPGATVKRAG